MTLIERYILKIAFNAFLACLAALTGVIWITQALRELDLLTAKGQTLMVFLTVTGLSLPALVTVIAPVALFIATVYALNRLNGDSELIVMSAAGMRPRRILRPFLTLGAVVSLTVAISSFYLTPASFQELRELITKVRADFLANVVKEGQFTAVDKDITFHFRERAGDALLGIFIQDRRERDKPLVYMAERGRATDANGQSYLVLEKGSIHRQDLAKRDSSIVTFERYAVDLAAFAQEASEVVYKPRERGTMQLLFPNTEDPYYKSQAGRFRAELHDRLAAWLYPFAVVLIAFAALGTPQTTRQGRGAGIAAAAGGIVVLRIAGFAATSAAVRSPAGVAAIYAVPVLGIVLPLLVMGQATRLRHLANGIAVRARSGGAPRRTALHRA
ncbi:MAG TPA: LPS export ABC transporter permease LptF [Microvirga sp.]|jgi:lipopolysaccharide export system permease protein|nr:LPS export ABC transporter permease LptF [Microvirga sp.]